MYMVDVKNRFGVEQLRNMGCGYAPRSQYWPLKKFLNFVQLTNVVGVVGILCTQI